ncbi:hypothetical protein C8R43DRAFT_900851, partial [Mycena crocata]
MDITGQRPIGLIWDATDHSCGYDATFTILANIWAQDGLRWAGYFSHLGEILNNFGLLMQNVRSQQMTFERARDHIRRRMHDLKPEDFPYGPNTTSIDRIANCILPSSHYALGKQVCPMC